jgi:predicted AAA+ superfamily ATPase
MLPLELRPEFQTKHMRGTAIELHNRQNSGWAQREPTELLRITYPTADVQRSLEAVSRATIGKPIVLLGQRGRGKSHIMALLHHAFESPDAVEKWACEGLRRRLDIACGPGSISAGFRHRGESQ